MCRSNGFSLTFTGILGCVIELNYVQILLHRPQLIKNPPVEELTGLYILSLVYLIETKEFFNGSFSTALKKMATYRVCACMA